MICITVDGSNEQVHDKLRGSGSFKKTIEGIKFLQKYNIPITVLFTLNKYNVDDLIDSIKFNEQIGIKRMSVMVVCPTGRASDGNILVSKEQWYPIFLKLSEMKRAGEVKLKFRIAPPNESAIYWFYYFPLKHYGRLDLLSVWNQEEKKIEYREISCQAGTQICAITHNGDVYGCDLMVGINDLIAGNIRKNTFKEIWENSDVFRKIRAIEIKHLEGKCKECDYEWCGGGCRSAAFHMSGDIKGSDESCYHIKE
jgi:radical SAM protein with 4Fe4S-binding SPASM domain